MNHDDAMCRIDVLLAHVWMVRTFLKHAEESQRDVELRAVHRALYDYMLALGSPWQEQDADAYVKQARKKYTKLAAAARQFGAIQADISGHTNFRMAARSLAAAVAEIGRVLELPAS